jgi:hypothetical protein
MLNVEMSWPLGNGHGWVRVKIEAQVTPEHEHIVELGHIVSEVHEMVGEIDATLRGVEREEVE